MHYNCVWHIKSIYPTKFQVNTVTNVDVIWKMCLVMQELWLLVSVYKKRFKGQDENMIFIYLLMISSRFFYSIALFPFY